MLQKLYVSTDRVRLLLIATLMVMASATFSFAQVTLGQYTFTASPAEGTPVTLAANAAKRSASSVNANVTFSAFTVVGATENATANVANYGSWPTGRALTTHYVQFTITPNAGVTFSITQIGLFSQRSGTGPNSYQIRSSQDSYTDSLGRLFTTVAGSPGSTNNFPISGHTGLTSAVTFRIYGYRSGGGTLRFDNVTITGTAVSSTPELTLAGTTYPFNGSTATAGASQSFTISGANLTGAPGNISVSGPTGYEFSLDNSSFSAPLNVPYSSGTLSLTTLYARIAAGASPTGELSGNITATGGSATSNNLAVTGARSATFTAGNLVVLRAGDGVGGLVNTGNPISFVEYSPTAPGSPINIANAIVYGTNPIIQSNTASSEGQLTRTPDGTKLVFVGYKQSLPNATSIAGTSAPTVPRIISTIDNNGNYQEAAVGGSAFTGGNIRGGVSTGSTYIASGQTSTVGQAGIRGGAGFGTQLSTAFTNTRQIRIQNGRLMFNNNFNSGALNIGLIALGLGVDGTTLNQQEYQVNNAGSGADPYDFAVSPDGKTIYIADQRLVGTTPTSSTGGIQRWDFNTSTGQYTWTRTYPTTANTTTGAGPTQLLVEWGTTTNNIYTVSGGESGVNSIAANNNLLKIIDDGTASGTYSSLVSGGKIVVLASAGANRLFRGVEFAPVATPEKKLVLTTYGPGGVTGYFQASSINDGNMGSGIFGTSKVRTFYVSGTALTSTSINVTLSGAGASAFGVRIGGSGAFASSVAIPSSNIDVDGNLFATRIDVEYNAAAPAATSNATITVSGGGATLQTIDISATSVEPLNYYLRNTIAENSSVDLSDLSNWTDAVSGIGGSSPASLSADGQIFNINKSVTVATNPFSVSGASSEISVATGKTLTTGTAVTGAISLVGTASLNITETGSAFIFNDVSTTSTVVYSAAGAQSVPAVSFGNLTLSGTGDKTLADNIQIFGNLTIENGPTASVGGSSTNIYVRGDINLGSTVTFSTNWTSFAVVRTAGTATQTINGPGVFRATELRIIDKASGAVNLATNANIGTFTSNGVANFADGGNTITMTNNLQLTGDGARYSFTGTLVFAGTSGTQQVRNANGIDGVIVAQLNNVTCSQAGATVNFQPSSGSATIIVKGNFTVNTSNSINLNSNTLSIRGNYVRQSGSWTPAQASTVEFASSGSPSITGSGVVTFGGLRVALSGINTLTLPADLNVRGNLTIASGVLGSASRKVTFNGTAAQTVIGTFTAQDVEINNTTGVTVLNGGVVNVSRELKLNANNSLTINSGGVVRLLSTATQTAYLSAIPSGAAVNGNITQERYLHQPGVSGWYFWASPVKGQTIANLHSQVPQKGFSGVLAGNPTFYFLDDNVVANNGWVAATNVTNSIESGIGFRSYGTVSQLGQVGNKLSWTGVPVIGNGVDQVNTGGSEQFTWTLTNVNAGYNLLGNPYPSALLWDNTANWSLTNVSPTIHKWDASTSSYKVWNSVTASGTAANGVIPTGASFVAQSAGPGASSLSVREAAKTATSTTWTFRQGVSANTLRLKMTNGLSNFNDEAIVSLSASGARTRTIADAGKLMGGALDIALVVDGSQFTVKDLNKGVATQTVGLSIRSHVAGMHTINFSGLSTFASGFNVMLHDATTGSLSPLADNADIQVSLAAGQTLTRYSLVFNNTVTSLGTLTAGISMSIYPNPAQGQAITVQVDNASVGQTINLVIRDLTGRQVYSQTSTSLGLLDKLEISKPFAAGVYTVTTDVAGATNTQKLIVR